MKILQLCFLLFGFFAFAKGQSIELGGGVNRNSFYNFGSDDGHFRTDFDPGNGYSVFLSWDDTIFTDYYAKLLLTLDNYNGTIFTKSGSLGGSSKTDADVNKKTIGLTFCLLNYKIANAGCVSIGPVFNYLLSEKMSGYHSSFSVNGGGSGIDTLENNSTHYVNDFTFGLTARATYDIRIAKSWFIVPQFFLYIGLSNDFRNIEAEVKSFRQTIAVGVKKQLMK